MKETLSATPTQTANQDELNLSSAEMEAKILKLVRIKSEDVTTTINSQKLRDLGNRGVVNGD